MVDDLEDADSYPIPATRNSFLVARGSSEVWNRYAGRHAAVGVGSLLGMAALVLRK